MGSARLTLARFFRTASANPVRLDISEEAAVGLAPWRRRMVAEVAAAAVAKSQLRLATMLWVLPLPEIVRLGRPPRQPLLHSLYSSCRMYPDNDNRGRRRESG